MIDGGRLHGRNLLLAERLAHDVEATGERGRVSQLSVPHPTAIPGDRIKLSK